MQYKKDRQALINVAQAMETCGLSHGRSGNLSQRVNDSFLITPTGIASESLELDQIVLMGLDGQCPGGQLKPSSEWRFHRDLYQAREEFTAIIHTHSTHATVLACLREDIPPFHYMIAEMGGENIRCAEYATFGTQALSDNVIAAMQDRKACLMANHGMLVAGSDLKQALELARQFEELCKQYVLASQLGEPVILSQQEMAIIVEKFKHYGVQDD